MNKKRLIIYLCLSMFLLGFSNVKAENDIMPLYDADTDSGNGSGGNNTNRVTGTLNVSSLGAFYINKSELDSLGASNNYYFKFTFYPLNSAYAYLDTQVPTSIYLGSDFLSVPVEVLNNSVADSLGYVLPSRHNIFSGSGCDITSPDNIEVINYSYSSNLALTIYGTFNNILDASKIYIGCGNTNGEFICINGHYYKGYFDIGNYTSSDESNYPDILKRMVITNEFLNPDFTNSNVYDPLLFKSKTPQQLLENGNIVHNLNAYNWIFSYTSFSYDGYSHHVSAFDPRNAQHNNINTRVVKLSDKILTNINTSGFSFEFTPNYLNRYSLYYKETPSNGYDWLGQNYYNTPSSASFSYFGVNPDANTYIECGNYRFYIGDGKLWTDSNKNTLYTDLIPPTIITPDDIPDDLPDVIPDEPEPEQPDIDINLDDIIERLDTIITNQDTIIDILNKQIDEMQKAPLCDHSKMESLLESILDKLDKLLNSDEPENNIIVNVFTPNEKDVGNFVFEINEIMDSNTSILSYPFSVFYKVINSFASATGSGSSINSSEYQQAYLNLKNTFNESENKIDSQFYIDDTFNEGSVVSGSKINHVLAYPDMKVFDEVVIPSGSIDFDDLVINRFNGLYTMYMVIIKGMIAFSLVRFLYKKGREFLS